MKQKYPADVRPYDADRSYDGTTYTNARYNNPGLSEDIKHCEKVRKWRQ